MMISQDGVLDRGSVAVVVPAYNRAQFTPDEEISFRHLEHVLGRYDKFLAVPRSLEIERPGYHRRTVGAMCRQPLGGDAACRKRRVVSPKSLEFSARALVGTILDSS